jgi:hypothetical protein
VTRADIKQRLITIGLLVRAGNRDAAIHCERQLHADVLRAIADGKAGTAEAREALRSLELEFPRSAA